MFHDSRGSGTEFRGSYRGRMEVIEFQSFHRFHRFYLSAYQSVRLYNTYIAFHTIVYPSVYWSVCLSTIYLPFHITIYLCVYRTVHLPTCFEGGSRQWRNKRSCRRRRGAGWGGAGREVTILGSVLIIFLSVITSHVGFHCPRGWAAKTWVKFQYWWREWGGVLRAIAVPVDPELVAHLLSHDLSAQATGMIWIINRGFINKWKPRERMCFLCVYVQWVRGKTSAWIQWVSVLQCNSTTQRTSALTRY